jgi:hypothetical protein
MFRGCKNLTYVNLSNASAISENEFYESGIASLNAPNLTSIGNSAFSYCNSLVTVENLGNITTLP